jgi:2-polyprenyl-6-methoxyphenol hydroxylase-like FAD-dependent oxidoreductase
MSVPAMPPAPLSETRCDVLVCGGGVAGVAAAVEAAREGARVILLEKTILPGGLATSGLINVYLPLCDGNGRQATFGLAEELLHRSMRYGPGQLPDWRSARNAPGRKRYQVIFSPASFVLALDEALQESGVELWLDTLVCSAIVEPGAPGSEPRIAGVEAETKSGRVRFRAGCVVDATGDADVAHRADAECHGECNDMAFWSLDADVEAEKPVTLEGRGGRIAMTRFGGHRADVSAPAPWRASGALEVTRFVLDGRKRLREHYRQLYAAGPEALRQRRFPIALPTMAQFRTTRRIGGRESMRPGEANARRESSVGLAADWRKPGHVWETPYGALLPRGVRGLMVAGRCIAAEGDAWDVMRVIPAAVLTGQVCGLACALAVKAGHGPEELPVADVQARLRLKGIRLHLDEMRQG